MDFSGFEKLSLVDLDSNLTATLFMAGCPFRCPFCHNGDLVLHPERAPKIPFAEIMDYLAKRRNMLDAVCITGGEPTLMPDLEEKIRAIKELGYLIKLDTNGCNPAIVAKLIEKGLVDYVAMDIKNSPDKYGITIGIPGFDISKVKRSVEFLLQGKVPYEFRTTVVSQFHDEESMRGIAEWIRGADRYYLQEFVDRETVKFGGLTACSKDQMNAFLEIVKTSVNQAELRGLS